MKIEGFGSSSIKKNSYSTKSWKNFYLDGKGQKKNEYRILPAMHSHAEEEGGYAVYFRDHKGYKIPSKTEAGKHWYRPFRCVGEMNFKTKMVIKTCPECENIADHKAVLERVENELKAEGKTKEQREEILLPHKNWLGATPKPTQDSHMVEGRWRLNAMNTDGDFGVLYLPNKVKLALEVEIRALMADGLNPLDLDQGCWFRFTRSGNKVGEYQWKVEPVRTTERLEGKMVSVTKEAPLTEEQAKTALATIPDLNVTSRILTEAQIRMLVESDESPEAVEVIMNMGQFSEAMPATTTTKAPVAASSSSTTKATVVAAPQEEISDDDFMQMMIGEDA